MDTQNGNVVTFPNSQPFRPEYNSTRAMIEGLAAVALMPVEAANVNALGDMSATAYRKDGQDFVSTSFRDIMSRNDPYSTVGQSEIEWEVANLFFGLAASMRDCLSVLRCNQSNEFACADNFAESMANYWYIAQSKRGA